MDRLFDHEPTHRRLPRALTVRQPWASLIVAGMKPVESRAWDTRYRGDLLIHAGKAVDENGIRWCRQRGIALPRHLPLGSVIGVVNLYATSRDRSDSIWADEGAVHWLLKDPRPVRFYACRGQQGLWVVDGLTAGDLIPAAIAR